MEKENMKIVDLSTEITRWSRVSVLVHKDMVDVLSEPIGVQNFVQPQAVESHDYFSESYEECPVEIGDVHSGDPSSINLVLTKDGLVTKRGDLENLKSEDLVWEIK